MTLAMTAWISFLCWAWGFAESWALGSLFSLKRTAQLAGFCKSHDRSFSVRWGYCSQYIRKDDSSVDSWAHFRAHLGWDLGSEVVDRGWGHNFTLGGMGAVAWRLGWLVEGGWRFPLPPTGGIMMDAMMALACRWAEHQGLRQIGGMF